MPPPESRQRLLLVAEKQKLSRRRAIVVWTLIVLASVVTLLMVMTFWVKRQMLDNDSWRKASDDLVQNQDIRESRLASSSSTSSTRTSTSARRCPSGCRRRSRRSARRSRRAAPAGRERGQGAARPAEDPAALHRGELEGAAEARERARGQDRLRHLDRERHGHHRPPPARRELGTSLGLSQEGSTSSPAKAGVITLMSLRSARRGAEGREAPPRGQRLPRHPRARDVRARDLARPRLAARDASERRLVVHSRQRPRAGPAPVHRQLRRRRADRPPARSRSGRSG